MTLALRLARRELRGSLRSFRIFLLSLALGVAAIAAVGMVRTAIQTGMAQEGAVLLGGDAEAELTYRFARDDERAWLDSISLRLSEIVSFRSLAVAGPTDAPERALTEVQAVDDAYPLAGTVTLDPAMPLPQALAGADGVPGAVIAQELADRLNITPGDRFRLGNQDFVFTAVLVQWPDNATGGFGLGPRTILRTADLAQSGLIAEGTLFSTRYRVDLPATADLDRIASDAQARFGNTGLQWRDTRNGAAGTERVIDMLGSFLILVGLSGLAVGGIGVAAAVRGWIAGRVETIAVLRALGATQATISATYLIQIVIITMVGIALGVALGAALPLAAAPLIAQRLPLPAVFALYPAPLLQAALYGLLTALVFVLWPLARIEQVRPAALFRDDNAASRAWPRWPWLVAVVAVAALLIGAAVWLTGDPVLTLWTLGAIAAALGLLALAAQGLRLVVRAARPLARGRAALRLALGALARNGGETTATVLSLGLGLSVLAAVGQIDGNLRRAITGDLPRQAPSYFFVDIQPDQIDDFRARIENDPGVSRIETAPMLRGIITAINGIPATEVAGNHWVIRGDRGVTYSDTPPKGTTITAGAWWPVDYDGPPQISFAADEAAEIGLGLGDSVTVNILGRDITATVTSLRKVEFETVGIGFIISMNPTALAGAPHSWISTVYATPEAERAIVNDVTDAYPNITAVAIRDAVDRAARLVAGVAVAVRVGALVTLVTGFLVLIGTAAAGERARTVESAIARTLGATRATMLWSFALRAGLVGAAAGLVALAAGVAGGWAVTTLVMEATFRPIWSSAVIIVTGGAAVSLVAGLAFALRPLAARPAQVLRARD